MSGDHSLVVDVRIAEGMESLFLSPRDPSAGSLLVASLRRHLGPGVPLRRSAEGVRVPAALAASLMSHQAADYRWTESGRRFIENRQRAATTHATQLAGLRRITGGGHEYARSLLTDSTGLEVLDPHQLVNVAAMTMPDGMGLCVFDEQGAGKTVTMIYAYDLLVARDEVDVLLIVAPKSMVPEWPADFTRFRGDLYRIGLLTGSRSLKRAVLRSESDVFVTNFETAVSLEPELRALLRAKGGRAVLAVDESFFIKSLDAQRTRALRRLREWCGRAYVLCGTPAPNAPQDLVQQFNLVDYGQTFEGVDIPEDRQAALPVVQRAIDARGLYVRHLKADVLPDLPAKKFQRVYVPLEPQQRQAYEAALENLIVDLEAATEDEVRRQIPNFLARRAALLQICSNPATVVRGYAETPSKLLSLDGLLSELVDKDHEKVVVWSFYTASIDGIMARFPQYRPVRYDGQVTDVAARRDAVKRFQQDDETMLFVANPAAAGAGLTLHRARYAVYESLSNQAAHYLQSLDRIHRRGQARNVEYIVLLADGTIELAEYDRLIRKEAASQQLLRDQVDPSLTRETLLADAREAASLLGSASR